MQNITLSHGQIIRVKGFPHYAGQITIGTVQGYAAKYGEDQAEALDRAVKNGHPLVWSHQESAVLSSDYQGKAEAAAAKAAAIAAAVEVENGQIVSVEGRSYKVYVNGQQYSDPIGFKAQA